MGIGFSHAGRYRLYTDAERRAYGERKRLEARQAWHKRWITKTTLKSERNWTDWAINQFLGKPVKQAGRYRSYYVFNRSDVERTEKTKAFKGWMAKRIEKQKARKQL